MPSVAFTSVIDQLAEELGSQQKFLSLSEKRDLLLTLAHTQQARALTRIANAMEKDA